MPLPLKSEQFEDLALITKQTPENVVELCKAAFELLINGANAQLYVALAKKNSTDPKTLQRTVEALVSLLIDATIYNANDLDITNLRKEINLNDETLEVLHQFVKNKRSFVEGSIKSANLRAYRIVNIEWRLEARIASRTVLRQSNIFVTMKFYLHMEPKNENRDLLPEGEGGSSIVHPEEKRNRKDILVQTDLSSLLHIIQTLEDALMESKTRRIRV